MTISNPRPPRDEAEFASVTNLIQQVFADDATTQAHLALVRSTAFLPGSLPAVWHPDGRALAVVQAVPCKIALLGTWVAGGIITMVATDQDVRGQGHMRACMNAAHEWLKSSGYPLAILYGIPAVYPRFDYRPVMPHSDVRYPTPERAAARSLRQATTRDLEAITQLFNEQEIDRPCSIQRQAEQWIWSGGTRSMAVLESAGGITGYARYAAAETSTLDVIESATRAGHEPEFLDALHAQAAERGSRSVRLRLMPDHPLVREVSRRATQLDLSDVQAVVQPPQAGMLCVLDIEATVNLLQPQITRRLRGQALRLEIGARKGIDVGVGGPTVRIPQQAELAHVLSGYPGIAALRQWGALQSDKHGFDLAQLAFPTEWPRWSVEPYWGE
ncbi:MAG: GNAT family N-acetyltransferase [Chloroflexia bacterium]|nr:GNAT family N-acetyltransferase [Chloroflexia bacterium]